MFATTLMTFVGMTICLLLIGTLGYLAFALIFDVVCSFMQRRSGRQCAYELTRIDLDDLRRKAEAQAHVS